MNRPHRTGDSTCHPAGPTTPDGEPLAGWWWRVLAFVIDSFIVSVVTGFASIPGYIQVQREVFPVLERFVEEAERTPRTRQTWWASTPTT